MTAQELVGKIRASMYRVGSFELPNSEAVALVEKYGDERWQEGYDSGWAHCESDKGWRKVEANL